jgi:hypothetical protein
MYVLPAFDLQLEGPAKLRTSKRASYRVRALDPISHAPREGVAVEFALRQGADAANSQDAKTDEAGIAVFEVEPPESGDFEVTASTRQAGTDFISSEPLEVKAPGRRILLTSDKPLYQPGQTIQLRARPAHEKVSKVSTRPR